jgi:hypothetical protein
MGKISGEDRLSSNDVCGQSLQGGGGEEAMLVVGKINGDIFDEEGRVAEGER